MGSFYRTIQTLKGMNQIGFMDWVSDRLSLVQQFISLGSAGKYSRAELVKMFTKFMLAIARHVPESWHTVVVWGLSRVQKFA